MSINLEKGTGVGTAAQIATPYSIPRVNLLPPEVNERRAVRKVQAGVGAGFIVCLALAGAGFLVASNDKSNAEEGLRAVQATTAQLNTEQAKYSEVPTILAMVDEASQARNEALSQDIAWSTVMGQLAATYPADLWIDNVTAALTNPPGSTASTSTTTLPTTAVATLSFTGVAKSNPIVADWLDSLLKVSNVADTSLQSTQLAEVNKKAVVKFASSAALDEGAFTHKSDKDGN